MTENNFQIESAAITDRGLSKKRPQNEDSFLEQAERGLFAVADGVGGAQAGDVASQMAVETLSEAFANRAPKGDVEVLMRVAIERANESVYQMAHELPQLSTMATTVVALHISGNIATIGHVGDSRLYRLDARGILHRETGDHSVVEEELRAGRLTPEQAANHPNRNIISRAVGADSTVEVDLKTIMFEPQTTFLLCSDGITRHIEDDEIRRLLTSGDNLASITQKMKDICYERGAEDNLTAVIAKINDQSAERAFPATTAAAAATATAELEEPTVITARRSALIPENPPLGAVVVKETSIAEPPPPAVSKFASPKIITESAAVSPPPVIEKTEPVVRIEKTESLVANTEEKVKESPRPVNGGGRLAGRILSAVMWLILGGISGAGLYYLFLQNNKLPAAPVASEAPTVASESADFENKRRLVDANPRRFIETTVPGTPLVDAPPINVEYAYLLGRAYLLDGQFQKAEQMFLQARERLPELNEANRKVVAGDIEIGLAVAGVPAAREKFTQSSAAKDANALPTKTEANANLNSPPNTDAVNR